jgi:hypothetical protein
VKHYHSRPRDRPPVNVAMQLVVPKVVKADTLRGGPRRIHLHASAAAQGTQQCGGIVGYAGAGGGKRRIETDCHGFFLFPNRAVPTRM